MARQILIVDDSASFRTVTSMTLKKAGYAVVEACDGVDAIGKLSGQTSFDLIICDLVMPKMGGIEFMKAARQTASARFTPILVLSTETAPAKKVEAKASGAVGWLAKPFEPKQLVIACASLIR